MSVQLVIAEKPSVARSMRLTLSPAITPPM